MFQMPGRLCRITLLELEDISMYIDCMSVRAVSLEIKATPITAHTCCLQSPWLLVDCQKLSRVKLDQISEGKNKPHHIQYAL